MVNGNGTEALAANQSGSRGVGGTTWPTLPSCWARYLLDLRHFVAEAAEQQWAEFVEEGVAVTKIQQPAPHHRGHSLPDLPQDNREAASLESLQEGRFRVLLWGKC